MFNLALGFLRSEVNSKGHGKLAWMDYVGSKHVIPRQTPNSSHQIDFGCYLEKPIMRPYMNRNGMAGTTSDLNDGTTKATYHIPRYGGFIPQSSYNPTAASQGDGKEPRRNSEDLRLYHLNNIPNYTGHKPVDCKNVRGEAKVCTIDYVGPI